MINEKIIQQKNKNILAIDPSISSTGYAILSEDNNNPILEVNKYQTSTKDGDTDTRITDIVNHIQSIAYSYNAKYVIFEDGFVGKSPKTGLQLAELRGALIYILRAQGYEVYHMMPSEIRKAFGLKGNAKKEEVAVRVNELYPDILSRIGPYSDKQNKQKTSDMYDAISIGTAFKRSKLNN